MLDSTLDEILFIEQKYFIEGVKTGEIEGEDIGKLQGRLHGLEKGYEFGKKIGFIQSICKTICYLNENQKLNETMNERIIKNINSILKLIDTVPIINDHEFDYQKIEAQLDAKVKLLFTWLGLSATDTPINHKTNDLNY
ncbi:hypothetical protein K502DRAFT_364345 [Neoconidiobolus thromboides FSU 785]|nr:hypothetical protein K502DRAFT_364345 [Neoconidiobolus thromboides FSU 785]